MNAIAGSRPPWYPLPPAWRAHAIGTPGTVLLETAGGLDTDHISYLFASPEKILTAASAPEFHSLLDDIEGAVREGFYTAGRINYEAAYALHSIPATAPSQPLACFGLFRESLRFDHRTGLTTASSAKLNDIPANLSAKPTLSPPRLQIDPETYAEKFGIVQRYLAAGDTYQVNFTTRVEAELLGSPLPLYEALIESQPVDFASIVHFEGSLSLSFSPELFFRIEESHIVTRPMKGTAPRGSTPEEDAHQREWLARDDKNHAEHVMIVDLLRNDLGRICESGSVRTDKLFNIEAYPTLFQMTSEVSGTLRSGTHIGNVLNALFPSGSVTGAPKRRTMEIIRDLEASLRGIYTGAIGFVSPTGDACFSVPIRTLDVSQNRISMGVGGGIVADSTAEAEYAECLLKASFLNAAATAPQLIETMLWKGGYSLLGLHLTRLTASASLLGFRCDINEIRTALNKTSAHLHEESRVRLLLSADGSVEIASTPLAGPRGDLRVRIAARRVLSTDPWRQHKATRRAVYEREFAQARNDGFDEVLFLNEHDELVEGAISNLFAEIDNCLYTPPLSSGALPGVLRQHLLNTHANIGEKTLRLDDLASASVAYLGNALRGLRTIASFHLE
jgi:para-aminobenzoate synthetase/4-amino-4-deoxychorismate lyase